jgi:hypothetical protein
MFASTAAFAVVSDVVGTLSSLIMVDADLLAAIVADVDRTSPLSAIDDGDDDFTVSAIPVDSKYFEKSSSWGQVIPFFSCLGSYPNSFLAYFSQSGLQLI